MVTARTILFLLAALLLGGAGAVDASYTNPPLAAEAPSPKKALMGENRPGSNCSGEQWDPNTEFYYLRARWMAPRLGRFVSVDRFPAELRVERPTNEYLYGDGNPVLLTDPTGYHTLLSVSAAVGVSLGLASCRQLGPASGGKCGVLLGAVRWQAAPPGFAIDVEVHFRDHGGYSQACCEYRQRVWTVLHFANGPRKGRFYDTRPLHDDGYSRSDDKDGSMSDAHFATNDNPGVPSLKANEGVNYTFAAEQVVIDMCNGKRTVAETPLHIAIMSGERNRVYEGVPHFAHFKRITP